MYPNILETICGIFAVNPRDTIPFLFKQPSYGERVIELLSASQKGTDLLASLYSSVCPLTYTTSY